MPDETQPGAGTTTTVTATPPPPPATTTPPSAEPSDRGIGHVDAKDFDDPVWGAKVKNLYDGLQEKGTKLSAAEKRAQALEETQNQTKAWLADPRNAPQIRAYLDRIAPLTQAPPETKDETDEERVTRVATERAMQEVAVNQAVQELYLRIGQGDPEKGYQLYVQPDEKGRSLQRDIDEVLDQLVKGDPRQTSRLAYEIVMSRRPKPVPVREPEGTARAEGGRGSATPPAAPTRITSAADMIRAAGFASESDYLRAVGVL